MTELNATQRKELQRIADAGYLYEGQISGLVLDFFRRAGLVETTHDPGSKNYMVTAAGHLLLSSSEGERRG
jgi:hypothetical protein